MDALPEELLEAILLFVPEGRERALACWTVCRKWTRLLRNTDAFGWTCPVCSERKSATTRTWELVRCEEPIVWLNRGTMYTPSYVRQEGSHMCFICRVPRRFRALCFTRTSSPRVSSADGGPRDDYDVPYNSLPTVDCSCYSSRLLTYSNGLLYSS